MMKTLLLLLLTSVAGAQTWTTVDLENYANPDTVVLDVPSNMTIQMRWGSGTTWQVHTFAEGSITAIRPSAGIPVFGGEDPTPGVAKILQIAGTDTSAVKVNGLSLPNPLTGIGLVFAYVSDEACLKPPMQPEAGLTKLCQFHDGLRISKNGGTYVSLTPASGLSLTSLRRTN